MSRGCVPLCSPRTVRSPGCTVTVRCAVPQTGGRTSWVLLVTVCRESFSKTSDTSLTYLPGVQRLSSRRPPVPPFLLSDLVVPPEVTPRRRRPGRPSLRGPFPGFSTVELGQVPPHRERPHRFVVCLRMSDTGSFGPRTGQDCFFLVGATEEPTSSSADPPTDLSSRSTESGTSG